jgi:hypothetical protein
MSPRWGFGCGDGPVTMSSRSWLPHAVPLGLKRMPIAPTAVPLGLKHMPRVDLVYPLRR